jgi:hypothetical protein
MHHQSRSTENSRCFLDSELSTSIAIYRFFRCDRSGARDPSAPVDLNQKDTGIRSANVLSHHGFVAIVLPSRRCVTDDPNISVH